MEAPNSLLEELRYPQLWWTYYRTALSSAALSLAVCLAWFFRIVSPTWADAHLIKVSPVHSFVYGAVGLFLLPSLVGLCGKQVDEDNHWFQYAYRPLCRWVLHCGFGLFGIVLGVAGVFALTKQLHQSAQWCFLAFPFVFLPYMIRSFLGVCCQPIFTTVKLKICGIPTQVLPLVSTVGFGLVLWIATCAFK